MFWYIGVALDTLEVSMDEVLTANIDKLKIRYPEKFTENDAQSRADKEQE